MRLLRGGVRGALRCWPAAVWLYVATAIVAMPFALGIGAVFQDHLASSLDAKLYAAGDQPAAGLAVLIAEDSGLRAMIVVLFAIIVLFAIASTYLTGATIAAVSRQQPTSTHDLYTGGGRVFGRLLRLLSLAAPFWIAVVGLACFGLFKGVQAMVRDWVSEPGVLAARLIAVALGAAVIFWTSGAYDLMRVEAVARGEHRARFAFWRGLMRALRRPLAPLLIAGGFGLLMVLVTLLWSLIDARLSRASFLWIAIGFLFQQAIAFARAFLRVSALASAVELHRPTD